MMAAKAALPLDGIPTMGLRSSQIEVGFVVEVESVEPELSFISMIRGAGVCSSKTDELSWLAQSSKSVSPAPATGMSEKASL